MSDQPAKGNHFALLYWLLLINSMSVMAMLSLIPAIARESHIPDTLMVSVQTLAAAIGFFSVPIWATISDRSGRRKIILLGCLGFAISNIVTGIGTMMGVFHWTTPIIAFIVLVLGRSVHGLIGLAANPAAQAFIAERTPREKRTASLAALASSQGVGSIIGPAAAPLLIFTAAGLAGPVLLAGILAFVTLVLLARDLPDDRPTDAVRATPAEKGAQWAVWRDPGVRPFMVYCVLLSICQIGNLQVLGFHLIDTLKIEPIKAQPFAGFAMMAGAAAALGVQLVLIPALKLAPARLLRLAPLLAIAGNLLMAVAPNYWVIAVSFVIISAGYAFAMPGLSAGASLASSAESQGAAAGGIFSAYSIGVMMGPIIAMSLYHFVRPAPFLLNVLVLIGMFALALLDPALKSAGARPGPGIS
jgi:MFS family permease